MIRRATAKDAEAVVDFLRWVYTEDPATGGNPDNLSPELIEKTIESPYVNHWLYVEGKKILGILVGQHGNILCTVLGRVFKANLFELLAVDHTIPHKERVSISTALSLNAVDELRDSGLSQEIIWVRGPYGSRGSAWCRLLRMSEDVPSTEPFARSEHYLPFYLIWERLEAVSIGKP